MKTLSVKQCENIERKENQKWPNQRSKLACCLKDRKLYVCGGSGFDSTDFWIFHTDTGEWTKLKCSGDSPRSLQGHTLHPDWKNNIIYVFGGSFGLDTPFWSFDIESRVWKDIVSVDGPSARSGHEATFNKDCSILHVFGGYVNVTGSTSEHWTFNMVEKNWSLRENSNSPCPRHDFGSISDDDDWWIFGGSRQLTPLNDLWTYTFCREQWIQIKLKKIPEPIFGHKLVHIKDTILVVGGKSETATMWGFNIKKLKWSEIYANEDLPNFIHHDAICISNRGSSKKKLEQNDHHWRRVKISPTNTPDEVEEKYVGKIFINRAFSIESQNYGRNFFNSRKILISEPNISSEQVFLSDLENGPEELNEIVQDDEKEIETQFSETANRNSNQILILGCSSSVKYTPLTMWKLTLTDSL